MLDRFSSFELLLWACPRMWTNVWLCVQNAHSDQSVWSKAKLTGTNPLPQSSWCRRSANRLRLRRAAWWRDLQMAPKPHQYWLRSPSNWPWSHCPWSIRCRLIVLWIWLQPLRTCKSEKAGKVSLNSKQANDQLNDHLNDHWKLTELCRPCSRWLQLATRILWHVYQRQDYLPST